MKSPAVLISHKKKLIYDSLSTLLGKEMHILHLTDTDSALPGDTNVLIIPSVIIIELESFDLTMVSYYKKKYPSSAIVGLFDLTRTSLVKQFFRIGGNGVITLDSPFSELVICINEVATGQRFTCEAIKDVLLEDALDGNKVEEVIDTLTRREVDILRFVSEGKSSKEIASHLLISFRTVEVHRYKLLKKLKLKNTAELVNFSYPLFHGNNPEHLQKITAAKLEYFSKIRLDKTA